MTKIVNFRNNPRDYALALVDDGLVGQAAMLEAALVSMSHDDIRTMLDNNEFSPRFLDDPEFEADDDDEDNDDDDDEDEDEDAEDDEPLV